MLFLLLLLPLLLLFGSDVEISFQIILINRSSKESRAITQKRRLLCFVKAANKMLTCECLEFIKYKTEQL